MFCTDPDHTDDECLAAARIVACNGTVVTKRCLICGREWAEDVAETWPHVVPVRLLLI